MRFKCIRMAVKLPFKRKKIVEVVDLSDESVKTIAELREAFRVQARLEADRLVRACPHGWPS